MKNIKFFNQLTISKIFILFGFLLLSLQSYAGACNCVCCRCDNRICGNRVAAGQKIFSPMTYSDTKLLNLKPIAEKSVASGMATNSAITITQVDYQNIAQNGNSWIDFSNSGASFSMNIGTTNMSSPQTFTLPSNLMTYFNNYGRLDFINESSLDIGLRIDDADVVARKMFIDQDGNTISKYFHVDFANDGVYVLGTSWDLYDEADDNFANEIDYEFLDAPLSLNDVITSIIEEKDYDNNLCLTQEKETKTVDGYGSLILPNGSSVACLRISISVERRTRTLTQANNNVLFTDQSIPVATSYAIAFVTKQGHYFQALTSATSGTVTLTLPTYRFVQATNTLEEQNSVKINNDSKGVTINTADVAAHPSSILDVQSDSLGVLIPRISKANRPHAPATGLLVYQTDNTPGFYYYNGTAWRVLSSSASARIAVEENSQTGIDQLVGGSKFVKFETPQDNPENLIIQIQPEGDCNGVFVSSKTKEGFWVKELQKGKSNVKFSWKISNQ